MKILFSLFLTLVLFACSPTKTPLIQQNYDPSVDISTLHTYQWMAETASTKINPHYQQILRDAVNQDLEEKGYKLARKGDFLVAVHINLETRTYTIEDGTNLKRYMRTEGGESIEVIFQEGDIIISFTETSRAKTFFQGLAKSQVNRAGSSKKIEKQIRKAVKQILKDFPTRL